MTDPIFVQKLAVAFNEWLRRYQEHPEEFVAPAAGDYGQQCAEYLAELLGENFTSAHNCLALLRDILKNGNTVQARMPSEPLFELLPSGAMNGNLLITGKDHSHAVVDLKLTRGTTNE